VGQKLSHRLDISGREIYVITGDKDIRNNSSKSSLLQSLSKKSNHEPATATMSRSKEDVNSHCFLNWDFRFEELREFYRKNGHADVPYPFPENPGLSRWVRRQRCDYQLRMDRKGSLSAMSTDRIVRLMLLNFTWNLRTRAWEKSYAALIEFKTKHGHTNVTPTADLQLAKWTRKQQQQIRQYYSGHGNFYITEERVQRLRDIGFCDEWSLIPKKKARANDDRIVENNIDFNEKTASSIPANTLRLYQHPSDAHVCCVATKNANEDAS
jgi:Helicase associated domain